MHRQVLCSLMFVVALTGCSPPRSERDQASGSSAPAQSDDEVALELSDFAKRSSGGKSGVALPITPGAALSAELAPTTRQQLFSFSLAGPEPARLGLRTQAVLAGPEVDTVLALYSVDQARRTKRKIAENDDAERTRFSLLERELRAGSYLVEVRGYHAHTRGPFTLATTCEGAGCPLLPTPCPFGEQFSDLRERPSLAVVSERMITNETQLASASERAQLVIAVQQSSHSDVRTPSEALLRVDQQEIRKLDLRERAGPAAFTVYEYGVGDNSYGAIFGADSLEVLARIHDGDLIDCRGPR